jgi:SAM-dependent methyltransferase
MHASSLENMHLCYQRHIAGKELEQRERVVVLDVGGADVNGSYSDVFTHPCFVYLGADLAPGEGVDVVLQDPNQLPLDDAVVDIVVSGQMLEHCEFFWLTFREMIRVLKPGGYLFLIAPSSGPVHRFPVDCYRFYPDAYAALARYANCDLVESWTDERGPWRDLVGVFQRRSLPARVFAPPVPRPAEPVFDPLRGKGAEEEEVTAGQIPYLDVLARLHQELEPGFYLEIGVRHGRSLSLARCPALGIDPAPEITEELGPQTRLISQTSDDFFRGPAREHLRQQPDLVFIDGMHRFEYVLRDFMHVERHCGASTLVVIDDVFPNHPAQAERVRRTRVWTGDVWKIQHCLQTWRPDLKLLSIDAAPTGLLLVSGLDPTRTTLWDQYNPIVRRYLEMSAIPDGILRRSHALSPQDPAVAGLLQSLARARRAERALGGS